MFENHFNLLFYLGLTVLAQESNRVFTFSLTQVGIRELVFTVLVVVSKNWEFFTKIEVLSLFSRGVQNFTAQRGLDTAEIRWNLELNSQFTVIIKIESRKVFDKRDFVDVVVSSDVNFDTL
jgi:hypothetical protein